MQTYITGDLATAVPVHGFPGEERASMRKCMCNLHSIAISMHPNSAVKVKKRRIRSVENLAPTRSITLGTA